MITSASQAQVCQAIESKPEDPDVILLSDDDDTPEAPPPESDDIGTFGLCGVNDAHHSRQQLKPF